MPTFKLCCIVNVIDNSHAEHAWGYQVVMRVVRQVSCFLDLQGRALSLILGSMAHLSCDFIRDTHFQAKVWDEMTLHCAKRTVELRLTTIAWTAWVYYSPQGLRAIGEGMDCLCEFAAHLNFA